ncbi:MAG: DNA-processing protein DprA [Deltaproteobacteria bacterium]|nr:DNA-processing protein DprA [Deltaproteobacteria bacterium]
MYYWIALRLIAGIGNVTCRNLLARFGSPESVFHAGRDDLAQVEGMGPQTVEAIARFRHSDAIDREIERIEAAGVRALTIVSPEYPDNLRNIYDPPPLLYVKGSLKPKDQSALAVVGSRSSSDYGRQAALDICREVAAAGLTVVSGMARGIDSVAHAAALAAKGRTIAVLGCGVDIVYPLENKRLYDRIAENGAVVSEYSMGTKPNAYNFPARNRIISGLALGVLVVEAGMKSGSLITARMALEQGRDVFAVPGSIYSFKAKGVHSLLRSGAKLVEGAGDILEELKLGGPQHALVQPEVDVIAELEPALQNLYGMLQEAPVHIDELIVRSHLPSGQLSSLLLELELAGCVRQLPGKRFAKAHIN